MEEEVSVRPPEEDPEIQSEADPIPQLEATENTPGNTDSNGGVEPTEERAKSPIRSPKTPPKSNSPTTGRKTQNDSIAIDLDQIEAEVENEANEEEVNFEVNWRNDFDELEKALEDDSVKFDEEERAGVAGELEEVRTELEKNGISPEKILEDFYTEMEKDVLQISSLPADELKQAEERRIQSELERVKHEAEIQRRREAVLEERANEAKKELHEDAKKKQQLLQQKKELMILKARLEKENLEKSFSRAESKLNKVLVERQAEVQSLYGDLVIADEQYGGARGRRWRVEWTETPQPIQVKINCIRGLKDKIPVGRYSLMVSLYDRIGGHPMQWSNLDGSRWGTATLPVAHSGKYFNSELKIDQSVFTVAPSKTKLKPGMVLTFELFLLRGSHSPTDVAVAWGAFPISDANFDIVSGPFKTTMLRGHMDPQIDRYERIEQLISADLDHWLANIYFEIVRLPRFLAGQKEYEVELQFSSGILNVPDRIKAAEDVTFDGEKVPLIHNDDDLDNISNEQGVTNPKQLLNNGRETVLEESITSASGLRQRKSVTSLKSNKVGVEKKEPEKENNFPTPIIGSKAIQQKYAKNKDSDDEDEDEETEWQKVEGEKGLFYKQHYLSPAFKFGEQVSALIPQNKRIKDVLEKSKPKRLSHLEQLERHKYTVVNQFMKSTSDVLGVSRQRINYCSRVLLTELGLSQWKTIEFWILMVVMAIVFFVRIYTHYSGMWLYISAIGRGATVSIFDFKPYTVDLVYQADLLTTGETIGMVLMGTLTNIFILSLLSFFAFLAVKLVGTFPTILSQSILMFGLWTILDPLGIMIVDACLGRFQNDQSKPIADAYKLYAHFLIVENSGLVGIPITIFVYLVEIILASSIFYVYFLKIHNNGRLLDTYHRLHGAEEDFLVPYDQEISAKELTYICRKAEAWRGIEGERRKTIVTDFMWKEKETDVVFEEVRDSKAEVTVHVAIFTIHLDGLRELYRQFLRLPDGAIIEVFGDISSAALLPDVKAAMMRRQANFEELAKRNEAVYETNFGETSQAPSKPASRPASARPASRPTSAASATMSVRAHTIADPQRPTSPLATVNEAFDAQEESMA